MKVTSKLIKESGKRFMLRSDDDFLIQDFVGQLCTQLKGAKAVYCDSLSGYLQVFHGASLFEKDSRTKVLVLKEILKEDIEVIDTLLEVVTDDYQVIVERAALSRTKAYTRVKASYRYLKLEAPKEQACTTWVRKALTDEGLDFNEDVPDAIVKRRGPDMQALAYEVKKLKLAFSGEILTASNCQRVVSAGGEAHMFTFMEHFFRRRVHPVLQELDKMSEYTYVKLLHFMIGQVSKVYQVAIYKEAGHSPQDIADLMGLPPFILKTKYFTVLGTYGKIKLLRLLDVLNEADFRLRTSALSNRALLESYLLKALKL